MGKSNPLNTSINTSIRGEKFVALSFVMKYLVKYGNWKVAKVDKLLESETA